MNKQEFAEFYKKNKLVVIGVPIIVGILLFDLMVLRPARRAKLQPVSTTAVTAAPAAGVEASAGDDKSQPILPPAPLESPAIPRLSEKVESRFFSASEYQYDATNNIFLADRGRFRPPEPERAVVGEAPISAPVRDTSDLTYHGFLTLGNNQVAILKKGGRVLLTHQGQRVRESTLVLQEILADRVVMTDTEAGSEGQILEINLSSTAPSPSQALARLPPSEPSPRGGPR